jgi:predicted esterase
MDTYVHKFIRGEQDLTALVLHGTGADENDLIPLVQNLLPEVNILSLRGDESENGMTRFFRRFADGSFDLENIRAKVAKLSNFLALVVNEYQINPKKIVGFGFSNGANMLASLMLLQPELLNAAVLLRPTLPLQPDAQIKLTGKKILVASGLVDSYAPQAKVNELISLLKSAGAVVTQHLHPGGHELGSDDLAAVAKWYQQYQGAN